MIRYRSLLLAALLAGICAPPLPAQEESEADPTAGWPAVFRGTAEVRVVEVDVFVSDRDGNPVHGLEAGDFELFIDGEAVAVSNFYAVEGAQRRGPAPGADQGGADQAATEDTLNPAHLAVFVDNPHVTPPNRHRLLNRLREVVLAHRRDEMRVLVASHDQPFERDLTVRQKFTDVAHQIFVALDELEKTSGAGGRFESERRLLERQLNELPLEGPGNRTREWTNAVQSSADALANQVHGYAEQREQVADASLASLGQLIDLLAGIPGSKAILVVSEGLPLRPGLPFFEVIEHRMTALATGPIFSASAEGDRHDLSRRLEALAERANAAGVRLYTVDAAPSAAGARGGADTQTPGSFEGVATFSEGNRRSSLGFLAAATGGRAGFGRAAHDALLEGVLVDQDNHYSVGFTPPAGDEDYQPRRLEVRLRDGAADGARVRFRRTWRPRSLEERLAEHAFAAILADEQQNPLAIVVRPGTTEPLPDENGKNTPGVMVVPLLVEIPLGKLVLLPDEKEHTARVSIFVAVRDEMGRSSEAAQLLCPIRVPNDQVLTALGRSTVCGVRLAMRTGKQRVGVAVHDELADVVATAALALDVLGVDEVGTH